VLRRDFKKVENGRLARSQLHSVAQAQFQPQGLPAPHIIRHLAFSSPKAARRNASAKRLRVLRVPRRKTLPPLIWLHGHLKECP